MIHCCGSNGKVGSFLISFEIVYQSTKQKYPEIEILLIHLRNILDYCNKIQPRAQEIHLINARNYF